MRLSLRQIRYVCEVSRQGSIQAASRALNISQSSILAALDLAEQAFGARIFDRRPARGVITTPAGERFVSAGRTLLAAEDDFERTIDAMASAAPPQIRIGCFEPFGSLFMPGVLRRYTDSAGPVEIALLEGDQTQLHDWLAAGAVDLVVTYDIGPGFGDSVTPICRVPAHAVVAAEDPLAGRAAVSLIEIADRPLVLLDLPLTATYLLTLFTILAIRPRIAFRSRSYETVRCAVAAGFGASILNMRPLTLGNADVPGLVRLPLLDDLPPPTLLVADIYGPQKPAFVRHFIRIVRQFFADEGPQRFAVVPPERAEGLLIG